MSEIKLQDSFRFFFNDMHLRLCQNETKLFSKVLSSYLIFKKEDSKFLVSYSASLRQQHSHPAIDFSS